MSASGTAITPKHTRTILQKIIADVDPASIQEKPGREDKKDVEIFTFNNADYTGGY